MLNKTGILVFCGCMIFVISLIFNIFFKYKLNESKLIIKNLNKKINVVVSSKSNLVDLYEQKIHEIREMRNRTIQLCKLEKLIRINKNIKTKKNFKNRYLLFMHNEFSCDVCVEESLRLCLTFIDDKYLIGVGISDNERYLYNFIRKNNIRFPFYLDKNKSFSKDNSIWGFPAFILINENQKIEDILFPIKNNTKISEEFFRSSEKYLNQ